MGKNKAETYCLQVTKTKDGFTSEVVKEKPRCPFSRSEKRITTQGQNTKTNENIDPTKPILALLEGFPPFYYNSIDDCLEDYPYYLDALCVEDPEDQVVEFGYYSESEEICRTYKENSLLIYLKFRMTAYGPKDPLVEGVCSTFKDLIALREKYGMGMFLHYNCIDSTPFSRKDIRTIKRSVNKLKSK